MKHLKMFNDKINTTIHNFLKDFKIEYISQGVAKKTAILLGKEIEELWFVELCHIVPLIKGEYIILYVDANVKEPAISGITCLKYTTIVYKNAGV